MGSAGRLLASSLVAFGLIASGAPRVAAEVDLADLIVADPPEGYELTSDPTALAGPYTMPELFAALNQDPGIPASKLVGFRAHARTWDGADADRLFVLLVETPSNAEAAGYAFGASETGEAGDAPSFETHISGATGYFVDAGGGVVVHAVVWQQGKYAVQVVSGSFDSATGESAVLKLARQEVALLEQTLGFGITIRGSSDGGSSFAYQLGKVTGTLVFVGLVVGVVLLLVRRSRAKKNEAEWRPQAPGYFAPRDPTLPPAGFPAPPPPVNPAAPPPGPFGNWPN